MLTLPNSLPPLSLSLSRVSRVIILRRSLCHGLAILPSSSTLFSPSSLIRSVICDSRHTKSLQFPLASGLHGPWAMQVHTPSSGLQRAPSTVHGSCCILHPLGPWCIIGTLASPLLCWYFAPAHSTLYIVHCSVYNVHIAHWTFHSTSSVPSTVSCRCSRSVLLWRMQRDNVSSLFYIWHFACWQGT